MRYLLNDPTSWAFDMSYILYGGLFIMSGAYALSRNAHVRGDILFRLLRPRWQAGIELVLYFIFFYPGVTALIIAGYGYAHDSFGYKEVSVNSPVGVPIWQLKALIPLAGIMLFIQGIAQVIRCILCLRDGFWPAQLHDVEEMDATLKSEHEKEVAAEGAQ
jgi:TRAP-type mannitol/chloroaromatic compound transport system permease small subunit